MPDTFLLLLVALTAIALGVSLLAWRAAHEALRVARAAAGGNPAAALPAGGASKADRAAGQKLAERATALLTKVNSLPPALLGPGNDARARDGAIWTAAEVAALRETTPALQAATAEALASLDASLAWLLKQVEVIRATPRGSPQYLIDFPHDSWRRHYQTALAELQEIVARGEAAAKG